MSRMHIYQLIQLFTDERWHLMAHFRHNHRVALQFVHDGCWHVGIDLSFVGDESVVTVVIRYCMDVDECCNKKNENYVKYDVSPSNYHNYLC